MLNNIHAAQPEKRGGGEDGFQTIKDSVSQRKEDNGSGSDVLAELVGEALKVHRSGGALADLAEGCGGKLRPAMDGRMDLKY